MLASKPWQALADSGKPWQAVASGKPCQALASFAKVRHGLDAQSLDFRASGLDIGICWPGGLDFRIWSFWPAGPEV